MAIGVGQNVPIGVGQNVPIGVGQNVRIGVGQNVAIDETKQDLADPEKSHLLFRDPESDNDDGPRVQVYFWMRRSYPSH